MTYYEELGVCPEASAEEIRRAYRHQIKVFHPDLQIDERTRAWAETKVRRLNEIVEVLADPEQRRAYDHEVLFHLQFRPKPAHLPAAGARKPMWVATAGAACLAALLWTAPGEPPVSASGGTIPPPPASETRRPRPPVPARGTTMEPSRPEQERSAPRPVQRESAQDGDPVAASQDLPASTPPRTAETLPAPQVPPADGASTVVKVKGLNEAGPQRPPAGNPLEGTWLFLPSRTDSEDKLYPPKYIELRIQAEAGKLFGRYRSSYEVHDQALSPNVNFNFQGASAGGRARAAWTGPGGAHGSVELELLNPMNLRVNWKAEETGPGLDLIAGTAVLVKRLEN